MPKQWITPILEFMHKKLPCMRVRPFLGHNLAVWWCLVRDSAAVAELVDAQR